MASRATRRITESLSELLEAFSELVENMQEEFDDPEAQEEEAIFAAQEEIAVGLATEMRAALELVMDQDDYTPDDIATLISAVTEALEEIDPSIFQIEGDEEDDDKLGLSDANVLDDDDDYVVDDDYEDYDDYDDYDDDEID